MSDAEQPAQRGGLRTILLGAALLAAALGGALLMRLLSPAPPQRQPTGPRPTRPIVQIVRPQGGLPDLSDLIDRLCPSVALVVPHGADAPANASDVSAASMVSADGWLVTAASDLTSGAVDALFGDGRRAALSDVRTDAVSGLSIVKASGAAAAPLAFSDQAFPRVGQFGFTLATPAGSGCSAGTAMIGSDFLADGGSPVGYVRLQSASGDIGPGLPLLGSDGRVVGIAADDPPGAIIPAPIVSVIIDELIRNSLSPSVSFGFRAIDYAAPLSTRLGNVRSGAGVALVQPRSAAARSGLKAGDIITGVGGDPVSSASELNRALDATADKADLTIQRHAQQLKITVRRAPS